MNNLNKFFDSQLNDIVIADSAVIKYPELVTLGKHIAIDHGFYCTSKLSVADYVHIGPYVCIIGGKTSNLTIGEFVAIGAGTKFLCSSDSAATDESPSRLFGSAAIPAELQNNKTNKPITIERFSGIGVNVTIMPGVTVAEGTVIGPNSVVHKTTEPWTVYYNNKIIRRRNAQEVLRCAKQLGYNQ